MPSTTHRTVAPRLVVLVSSEPHLTIPNIEDRHNILQKYITEDVWALTTVLHTRQAQPGVLVDNALVDEVCRVDSEGGASNGDRDSRWRSRAFDEIRTLVRFILGGRLEGLVEGLSDGGRRVQQRGAGVDDVLRRRRLAAAVVEARADGVERVLVAAERRQILDWRAD